VVHVAPSGEALCRCRTIERLEILAIHAMNFVVQMQND
jgi:hypothetical protein